MEIVGIYLGEAIRKIPRRAGLVVSTGFESPHWSARGPFCRRHRREKYPHLGILDPRESDFFLGLWELPRRWRSPLGSKPTDPPPYDPSFSEKPSTFDGEVFSRDHRSFGYAD
jgi:hypothetical protein